MLFNFEFNIIYRQMKPSSASTSRPPPKPQKRPHYLDLPNEQYLKRNLQLLGLTDTLFQKQTKSSLQTDLFPKHQANPTGTKQFFYISFFCLERLTTVEERAAVQMWYPPRTVNQQVEYKKMFFKAVQGLEGAGRLPKNVVVSKGTIMGDSSSETLVQFLRFFSEMALRHQYLQKYSHTTRLIQLSLNPSSTHPQNNINKFYIHPFTPSSSPSTTSLDPSLDLPTLTNLYQTYIKLYLKKLSRLRTQTITPILAEPHAKLMRELVEQRDLAEKLGGRVPRVLLGENRAFDRRRIVDRSQEIWGEIGGLDCHFVEEKEIPVVRVEGEVDLLLQKWQPVKGIANILEANTIMKAIPKMKKQLDEQRARFKQLCTKLETQLKK